MDQVLMQLGVGGILIVLVLRMVFDFLDKQRTARLRSTQSPEDSDVRRVIGMLKDRMADCKVMAEQTARLYDWHAKVDADGVPVWYVRSSLEETIKDLSSNIKIQTEIMQGLVSEVKLMRQESLTAHDRGPSPRSS